jgi:hypothetical protein
MDQELSDEDGLLSAIFDMDVAVLLRRLADDICGSWFSAHLVEVLFWGGRLPLETSLVPENWNLREWFLGVYVRELLGGMWMHGAMGHHIALTYLNQGTCSGMAALRGAALQRTPSNTDFEALVACARRGGDDFAAAARRSCETRCALHRQKKRWGHALYWALQADAIAPHALSRGQVVASLLDSADSNDLTNLFAWPGMDPTLAHKGRYPSCGLPFSVDPEACVGRLLFYSAFVNVMTSVGKPDAEAVHELAAAVASGTAPERALRPALNELVKNLSSLSADIVIELMAVVQRAETTVFRRKPEESDFLPLHKAFTQHLAANCGSLCIAQRDAMIR